MQPDYVRSVLENCTLLSKKRVYFNKENNKRYKDKLYVWDEEKQRSHQTKESMTKKKATTETITNVFVSVFWCFSFAVLI